MVDAVTEESGICPVGDPGPALSWGGQYQVVSRGKTGGALATDGGRAAAGAADALHIPRQLRNAGLDAGDARLDG